MYLYRIYGLNIKSYREIKELVAIKKTSDIDIELVSEEIPIEKKKLLDEERWLYYSETISMFRIRDNAIYLIENGNRIVVEEFKNCNAETLKTFLLGTALGLCLKQRNIVAMHGSSILIGNNVVICTGKSGAGKSTITNSFREKGFKFLADDVSALDILNENTIIVNPAYPQQKICKDIMEKMGYEKELFKLIDECRGKYVIPARESFVYDAKKLTAICEISISDDPDVNIQEITGVEKLKVIIKNIYRQEIFLREGMKSCYFKNILNIAKNILVYKIFRPKDKLTVDEQIDIILKELDYKELKGELVYE